MKEQKKILSIQYLRGLAALGVVCCHYGSSLSSFPLLSSFFNFGQTGVYVFFFISGFIMLYALLKEEYKINQFFRFLLKRSIRIDPSYYVTILLTLGLFFALSHTTGFKGEKIPFVPGQFIAHIFYAVPFTHYQPYNHVFWTLFVEFQFYLIIGTLYFISSNNWYKTIFISAFSLTCFIPVFNSYYMITTYAPIFGVGMAMVIYFKNQKVVNLMLPGLLILLIGFKFSIVIALVILLTITVVLFFTFRVQILKLLGDVSYSLYLTHPLVLIVFSGLLKKVGVDQNKHQLIIFIAEVVLALLFAYVFYRLIEKPTTDLSKRVTYKKESTLLSIPTS